MRPETFSHWRILSVNENFHYYERSRNQGCREVSIDVNASAYCCQPDCSLTKAQIVERSLELTSTDIVTGFAACHSTKVSAALINQLLQFYSLARRQQCEKS